MKTLELAIIFEVCFNLNNHKKGLDCLLIYLLSIT